ncbi:phage portal protein [Tetragenococcus koreensis]|uniref:phage portal protein n=1 Tax=Tetragenococcus koreensis TaxID=290335 RepID=UPI001F16C069|nr:phage portal protein [Tetragenococcus koreensis]MCF1585223.1 phage portal protein [Tetragenococcus koreensis]MCF1628801.1 phage portal protein [Tetragenococcus koreensis]MCF1632937.1 phage portal protein [Tetragenococcus koreensis]MDN6344484.1 phage portal protein [Tetragenococcus koreensis]MDN6384852.1 phage portal protein [Tetragenococcus koreensis]
MPLLDLGFKNKQDRMNRDLERLLYWQEHGTHASYTGIHALRNSDVFTAVRIIAADVASTKLKIKGHETNMVMNDVLDLFNNNPDSDLPGWHFKFIIIANMLLNGQSFVEIIRDDNNFPTGFHFLHNDLVGLEEKDGEIIYNVSEDINGNAVKITSDDVLHFRYITLDGYVGYSPLYSLAHEIGISQGSKSFLRNFFDNGGTSTSVLKYRKGQINDEQLKDLKENFANSQLKNNGGLVAIDDTMEFSRLQIPTEVLNFLNSYKFSTNQVAKAFGLPVSKLGIETVNTSITQANLEYLQSTLDPIFKSMIAEMETKIFKNIDSGYELEFDSSRLVDIDPELKLQRVMEMLSKGSISVDESRSPFGYAPIEDGNGKEPLIDLNKAPLSALKDYQRAKIKNDSPKGGDVNDE